MYIDFYGKNCCKDFKVQVHSTTRERHILVGVVSISHQFSFKDHLFWLFD